MALAPWLAENRMQLDDLKRCDAKCIARYWSRMAWSVWASVGATIFLLATLGAGAAETKQVLMLHSFGREVKPWSEYARTIRAELDRQSPWPLEITEHSLLTARSSDENPDAPFVVEYLRALHAKRPLDLIVTVGAPAVAFVQRHRQQLFVTTPMVFTAAEQRRVQYSILTANDTVVAFAHSYRAVFENILRVLPDTATVAVVNGNSPNENFWLEEMRREAKRFENRISFIWYSDLSFEEILKHAAALPPQSAIFWHLMNVDAAGVVHEGDRALARLHAVANTPIFSHNDALFRPCDCWWPDALGERGEPPGSLRGHSHPWRREGWRHQGTSHRVCKTQIRLEGNAAVGDQRKPPDGRKRDLFSRTDCMGSVSCTNPDGLCCNPAPVCTHLLAALPVAASSFLKSRTHELSGRVQASGSNDAASGTFETSTEFGENAVKPLRQGSGFQPNSLEAIDGVR
jgi:hypothetical protein